MVVVAAVALIAATGLVACTKHLSTLNRPEEPVTLDGSSVPKLLGTDPSHVVAFAWDSKTWTQVPVQVDQRDWVNPGQILHRPTANWAKLPDASPFTTLVYTPPAASSAGYTSWDTYTPSDSDPMVDANDQISFLSDDAGVQASSAAPAVPAGVDAASEQEVKVTDPLVANQFGYVYLFHSDTLTGGGAGTTGVNYTFSLDSGSYLSTTRWAPVPCRPTTLPATTPSTRPSSLPPTPRRMPTAGSTTG